MHCRAIGFAVSGAQQHVRGGAALISSRTDYGDRLRGPATTLGG